MDPGFCGRVVLHLDFDCYYVQVEMKRLGIPRETPCAVQQWEGLIAVNYPARAKGVTRHMRVKEAKKICPDLVLVHVETIGNASGEGPSASGGGAVAGGEQEQGHSRLTQKACLERYRRSTAEVLALLHRLAPGAVMEKASIDEVYLDVTDMVDRELQAQSGAGASSSGVDAFAWGSVVVGGPLDVASEFERRLAAGAGIACRLRGALLREMGYTSSAGIGANKLLAKIGSAMHKPNQQTVIPPRSTQQVMQARHPSPPTHLPCPAFGAICGARASSSSVLLRTHPSCLMAGHTCQPVGNACLPSCLPACLPARTPTLPLPGPPPGQAARLWRQAGGAAGGAGVRHRGTGAGAAARHAGGPLWPGAGGRHRAGGAGREPRGGAGAGAPQIDAGGQVLHCHQRHAGAAGVDARAGAGAGGTHGR